MPREILRRAALLGAGAALGPATYAVLHRLQPGGAATWERTNHRGEQVSLLSGPALAISSAATAALGAPVGMRAAAAGSALASGAVGVYDDIVGQRPDQKGDKGFRGHLGALRQGRITAGLVKIAGVGLTGVVAAGAVTRNPVDRDHHVAPLLEEVAHGVPDEAKGAGDQYGFACHLLRFLHPAKHSMGSSAPKSILV